MLKVHLYNVNIARALLSRYVTSTLYIGPSIPDACMRSVCANLDAGIVGHLTECKRRNLYPTVIAGAFGRDITVMYFFGVENMWIVLAGMAVGVSKKDYPNCNSQLGKWRNQVERRKGNEGRKMFWFDRDLNRALLYHNHSISIYFIKSLHGQSAIYKIKKLDWFHNHKSFNN